MRRLASGCALLFLLLPGCNHPDSPRIGGLDSRLLSQRIDPEGFDHALLGRAIFDETNRVRAANGRSRLRPQPGLDAAADTQASYLALQLRADHFNPLPRERTPAERVQSAGLHASVVAENALMEPATRDLNAPNRNYTYGELAAVIVDRWLNSPPHRVNLLNPGFSELGCAARLAHGMRGQEWVFATEVFLAPASPSG